MATITSTIKLVDQMTPTLNKISKAIDNVNAKSKGLGSAKTWNGFNTGVQTATKGTHNLYNALRRAVFMVGMLRGLKGAATVSDTMMNANARINNITGDLAKTQYYMDAIYLSAQRSRSAFMDTANSVGKLATLAGSAFDGSMEQVIAFTELMNKLFVISGASAAEASNAMYQLTQAMAAGKLQGDEMRSILENAPMLAQKIAEKLGVAVGEVKQLGAEGKITADVIKDALFESADEIEEKFENMPKTIGQTWTEIANYALNAFRPVIDKVQQFINSPMFEKFKNKLFGIIDGIANAVIRLFDAFESPRVQNAISRICNALGVLWQIALDVGNVMVNVAIWICDNWNWIAPIVYGVVAALLAYKAVMVAVAVVTSIVKLLTFLFTTELGKAILIIGLVVAAFYLAIAVINHFCGTTISATGIIFSAIAFVISGIIWLIQTLLDVIKGLGWLIGQVFIDLVDFVAILFTDIIMFLVQFTIAAITLVVDAVVFVGDIIGSIIDIAVFVGNVIWQVFSDIVETLVTVFYNMIALVGKVLMVAVTAIVEVGSRIFDTLLWVAGLILTLIENILKFVANILIAVGMFLAEVAINVWNTFVWIAVVMSTWGSNMLSGMQQLCQQLPLYWEYFKAATSAQFWGLLLNAGKAFNALLKGASDIARKMVQPFENFANAVVGLLNKIIDGWNSLAGKLTLTLPEQKLFGKTLWKETTVSLLGNGVNKLDNVSWNDWDDPSGINLGTIAGKYSDAMSAANSALSNIGDINWNTNEIPSYSDYVNWGSTIDAFKDGFNTFEYGDYEKYNVSWDGIWDELKSAWDIIDFKSFEGIWNGEDYLNDWNDFKAALDQTWDPESYLNPLDAFVWEAYENPFSAFEGEDYIKIWEDFKKNFSENINPFEVAKEWYDRGAALEDGISGFIDGIGALISGLFGGTGGGSNGNPFGEPNLGQGTGGSNDLPSSLEDLLGGYDGGGRLGDTLGAIKDNTGSSAGSAGNIEDTLELAEEELELLRKLAEQEVINRFTTAEIHVDMTNNNNINSKMDLDGIVTHLSNKLYEELGVVASGVHY